MGVVHKTDNITDKWQGPMGVVRRNGDFTDKQPGRSTRTFNKDMHAEDILCRDTQPLPLSEGPQEEVLAHLSADVVINKSGNAIRNEGCGKITNIQSVNHRKVHL